jgi:hypothetical protein
MGKKIIKWVKKFMRVKLLVIKKKLTLLLMLNFCTKAKWVACVRDSSGSLCSAPKVQLYIGTAKLQAYSPTPWGHAQKVKNLCIYDFVLFRF